MTSANAAERLLAGETLHERCGIALDYLSHLDAEGWFQQPVTDDIAPGYSEFVQEPMDMSTVRTKLADGEYGTDDGETLLLNVHLSSSTEPAVELPDTPRLGDAAMGPALPPRYMDPSHGCCRSSRRGCVTLSSRWWRW